MLTAELDRPALAGLREIELLQDLGDDVLAEVARACHFLLARPRQVVMSRADPGRDCFFVLSGRLHVVALSPGGREVSFRDAHAGEILGEMAALDGRPRSATVVALQDSLLARLSPLDLKDLLRRHWSINERMLRHLARTARVLTERVYELSTLNVQKRLCAELLRLALAAEGANNARVVLRDKPSHKEIAARIGTSREQVTRELGELVRLGLVGHVQEPARDHEFLVVEDLHRLAERIESIHIAT